MLDAIQPFVWGAGGEKMTPEALARRRALNDAMRAPKGYVPKGGWDLVGALAGEGVAAFNDHRADSIEGERRSELAELLSSGDYQGVLGSEWASPQQTALAGALMSRQDQMDDRADQRAYDAPMRDLQLRAGEVGLEQAMLELEQARNPIDLGYDPNAPASFQEFQLGQANPEYEVMLGAGGGASAAEEKINRIMELGYPREDAIVISDLSVLAQDETGRQQVVRRDTGLPITARNTQPQPDQGPVLDQPLPQGGMSQAPVGGPFMQQQGADQQPGSYSTVPEGTNVGAALGAEGFVSGGINSIVDTLTGNAPFPEQQEASNALSNLRMQTITSLMEPIAGRPSVFTQEMIDQIVVRPNMGSANARDRFQQTQTMIDQQIRRIDEQILNNPDNWTPDEVRTARTQRNNMSALRDTYADMIASLERSRSQDRPPLESFERAQ